MGMAERSRARVEDLLSDLERMYHSFPVHQRTVALATDRYEQARRRYATDTVDTYVRIENEHGEVLHVDADGGERLPGTVGNPDEELEHELEAQVAAETGVECAIEGVEEVTIAGISNADADDEADEVLYRLLLVYSATHQGGEPRDGAEWLATGADTPPAYV